MSFHQQLKRLRDAAGNRQEGVHPDKAYVERRDLKELIYHFDRIDGELRKYYANRNYWKAKAEGEKLAREALQEELDDCQWISVDDRLPENNTVVLTYDRGGIGLQVFCNEFSEDIDSRVTHWQPLPRRPALPIENDKPSIKDIVYAFMDLSYIKRESILTKLSLLDEEDKGLDHIRILEKIITKAKVLNYMDAFWQEIKLARAGGYKC